MHCLSLIKEMLWLNGLFLNRYLTKIYSILMHENVMSDVGPEMDPNCLQRLSLFMWPYHNIYMHC